MERMIRRERHLGPRLFARRVPALACCLARTVRPPVLRRPERCLLQRAMQART
ncbi:hypothetical protein [Paraburkholderia phosphatilytica]|uniref:hypothetical protein n=1 Tax=Paraburkholderia phosphatilytica TaxID=2282883 RepID=UPI0013E01966|nr:hypothetical protein [Paraburkholderia phosphatilytica]